MDALRREGDANGAQPMPASLFRTMPALAPAPTEAVTGGGG